MNIGKSIRELDVEPLEWPAGIPKPEPAQPPAPVPEPKPEEELEEVPA